MGEPAIEVRELFKSYGSVPALRGLSLCVERGRVVALLGPNGAGKTTCLRILIGLLHADSGTVRVLGREAWTAPPEHRRRIGYLSEEGFAWPRMTFERAAAFASSFFPTWDGGYLESLAKSLQVPGGVPLLSMSRGQARKAALALVLAPKPDVLLLDDPASGLDPAARREMTSALAGLLRETGSTILYSSHILSDVERLADEVCIIRNGRAVLHRPLEELKTGARRLVLRAPPSRTAGLAALPGVLRARREGEAMVLTVVDPDEAFRQALDRALGGAPDGIQESKLSLEDLYIEVVGAGEPPGESAP